MRINLPTEQSGLNRRVVKNIKKKLSMFKFSLLKLLPRKKKVLPY